MAPFLEQYMMSGRTSIKSAGSVIKGRVYELITLKYSLALTIALFWLSSLRF